MSRSGYSDDCEYLDLYQANVDRALTGKRGQLSTARCLFNSVHNALNYCEE